MADKAIRASEKLVPRLSERTKDEVCRISKALLDDMDRSMQRSLAAKNYSSLRIMALEAEWLKRFRSNC